MVHETPNKEMAHDVENPILTMVKFFRFRSLLRLAREGFVNQALSRDSVLFKCERFCLSAMMKG